MRMLIALNFAVGALLMISMVVFEKYEGLGLLTGIVLLPCFLALALVNVGAIFFLWKKNRFRAFVPIGTYVIAAALFLLGARFGTKVILKGTPCDSTSFFDDQTRSDLTQAAKQLVAEHQGTNFSTEIIAVVQKHGLKPMFVDDQQEIVVFGYYHLRHWYEYIWAENGLSEPYSMDTTITSADIENWSTLKRIIKQGSSVTELERRAIEFTPSIAFPLLKASLGAEFIERVRNSDTTTDDFSIEDKKLILAALNRQLLASNALVENSHITFKEWHRFGRTEVGLHLDKVYISNSFWVAQLLKQLLSEGVLSLASDGQHLKIKGNLTDRQRLQVEWLHVGIMNFAYGNLLDKKLYVYRKRLGSNWYFNDW